MELRPLGFGEIFDRAVTLYVRNLVPFASIVVVFVLPISILQYLLDLGSQPEFSAIVQILRHPARAQSQHMPTMFESPGLIAIFIATLFFTYLLWPFALNAVAVGVAALYRNRPVVFRTCYEIVLRRWLQIVGMILLDFVVALVWYVATVLLIAAIVVVAVLLGKVSAAPMLWFWFGFIGAILVFIVSIPLLAPLYVALTFSMYSVVIEERGVLESLSLGFARIFNRAEFWRALLFAVAAGATVFGGSMMFGILAVAAAFAHLPGLQAAIEGLARAVITPFAVVLLAVYYFDVRIRREGFDLEASLERLSATNVA
ncbi:MAG TPA: hypothetical protein VNU22_08540 [Candidatus Acidoferrum sp.]|jgi:hypothetical protein|nr:hypothetical protein [Candidatus Acidoferrum sp.]